MSKRAGLLSRYRNALKSEASAGIVLMIAAFAALVWSNSPWRESYFTLREAEVGPHVMNLHLSINHWASDGILTLFFFVVGLELKQEFTIGSLRDPRKAAVPILAAVFGMVGPSAFYFIVQIITGSGVYGGWAIPVATDIAFALAILAIFGRGLPPAARTFLMTLAVADDLGGIIVIAVFFSADINFLWLAVSLVFVGIFGFLTSRRITHWWLLWPLGLLAWCFMHASEIHATIAGVALGMMVPTKQRKSEPEPMTHHFAEKLDFASAGFALPIFAFFAAGEDVIGSGGVGAMLTDPVAIGIYLGLPVGKCIGIFGGVFLLVRLFKLKLGSGIDVADILPISLVSGIGFTVSLLIAQLSFEDDPQHEAHARVAVIVGTLLSVVLGALTLRLRLRKPARGPQVYTSGHHHDSLDTADDSRPSRRTGVSRARRAGYYRSGAGVGRGRNAGGNGQNGSSRQNGGSGSGRSGSGRSRRPI
ncbi:MAG: Na+/H+ antiporter NhaA [Actinomycetaceae bacterium]|nr:Na+/H+ antiporter NhaA [Actinomycetaceae bacterium]